MALGCFHLLALRSLRASVCLLIRDKEKGGREKNREEIESEIEKFSISSTLNPLLKNHKHLGIYATDISHSFYFNMLSNVI